MKKYTFLLSATFAVLFFALLFNESHNKNVPTAETYTVSPEKVVDTIVAQGTFIDKNAVDLNYDIPLKINKIFVKEGDYVSVGDPLFSIDREKTVSYIMESGAAGLISGGIDYSVITALPKQITATANGYVTDVNYISGGLYDTLNPVMSISNKENIVAAVTVSESLISKIKVGQKVSLKCPGDGGQSSSGKVAKIRNNAKSVYDSGSAENAVEVEIELKKDKYIPKLGFSVIASINLDTHTAILLPYECLAQDEKGEYVYAISEDDYAEKKYIKTKKDYRKGSETDEELGGTILVSNPENFKCDKVKLVSE